MPQRGRCQNGVQQRVARQRIEPAVENLVKGRASGPRCFNTADGGRKRGNDLQQDCDDRTEIVEQFRCGVDRLCEMLRGVAAPPLSEPDLGKVVVSSTMGGDDTEHALVEAGRIGEFAALLMRDRALEQTPRRGEGGVRCAAGLLCGATLLTVHERWPAQDGTFRRVVAGGGPKNNGRG